VLFAVEALRRDARRPVRVFVAATIAIATFLVTLVAIYATQEGVHRIQERYVFYVEPLVLIAFLAWIDAGDRPPRRLLSAVAATVALLPLALPYGSLLNFHTLASTPGLVPWLIPRAIGGVPLAVAVVAALSAAGAVLLLRYGPRRPLLAPTLAYLTVSSLIVTAGFYAVSEQGVEASLGRSGDPSWIDGSVGPNSRVAVIWSAGVVPRMAYRRVWQNEFFNRSVRAVYYIRRPLPYDLPQTRVRRAGSALITPDGHPLFAEYVLSDGVDIAGRPVARRPEAGLVLYRVDGPVRIRSDGRSSDPPS
jgi:hypothetical protein